MGFPSKSDVGLTAWAAPPNDVTVKEYVQAFCNTASRLQSGVGLGEP